MAGCSRGQMPGTVTFRSQSDGPGAPGGPQESPEPLSVPKGPHYPLLKSVQREKVSPPSQSPPLASWNLSCLNLVTQWRERSLSLIGNKAEDPEHLWGSQENPSVAPSGPRWFTCK